ncbi:uncharacterized protein MONBRDRAFT_38924 [Monosiga brevicollis MX1]|uniref:Nucleoside diphosphate kinase homolog 5 n=1 Tax=Monosiga brevicollis TaxID=81824 RepID=A9VB04_MONBE|nr:uncharacterized protein MONBRDRAFT_38924 [Monosiga brevicollis MX1]EDQ85255.1 predicted protein [Monosiga brevicollis MX1]|eukprot:XP_001749876.1 hypothetical protein [Monosiga brevicollis MX1]
MVFQVTLAMVKPDAIDRADDIVDRVLASGLAVLNRRRVRLTLEQSTELYMEHYGKSFFTELVAFMSSGPVLVMVLAGNDAVSAWRDLIGPTDSVKAREVAPKSIRALFGTDNRLNAVHGSDSLLSAYREIKFFFPTFVVADTQESGSNALSSGTDFLEREVNPTLIRGLTALCKNKPADPVRWLANWLEENNPNAPRVQEPDE